MIIKFIEGLYTKIHLLLSKLILLIIKYAGFFFLFVIKYINLNTVTLHVLQRL